MAVVHEMKAPEPPQPKVPKLKEKPAKKFKNDNPNWLGGEAAQVAKLVLSIQKSDCNSVKIIAELTKLYTKVKLLNFFFFVYIF